MSAAWEKASKSLVEVQRTGTGLERKVRQILNKDRNWTSGKVVYAPRWQYALQVDFVFPGLAAPSAIVSVTYTKPDVRGHSNENKLHLKVGVLALLKGAFPSMRVILAVGGSRDAWLRYVLQAFQMFFDEVVFLWDKDGTRRLLEIAENPNSVVLRHKNLWRELSTERNTRCYTEKGEPPPKGLVRYAIADALRRQKVVGHPSLIKNEIARLCMQRSKNQSGAEWENYRKEQWAAIEMSRNYFNPVEAAVEISLIHAKLKYSGGVARDEEIKPTLLHDLGMRETSLSEDFVLYSKKMHCCVYIQCKSSGGGRAQHGKNIQNRTKEQVTRALLYRSRSPDRKQIILSPKNFVWIGVLDGNWGVTAGSPLKYVHMLEQAGYDRLFAATDLIDKELNVNRQNLLLAYLEELRCEKL